MADKKKLMIPGPVEVSENSLTAMGSQVVAHYGEEWTRIYNETVELTRQVFQTENEHLFLIPGSGSAGLDAALGSTVEGNRPTLIPINGWFGERLYSVALTHSTEVKTLNFDPGKRIDVNKVNDYLGNNKEVKVLAATQCETSTGVKNPIKDLGKVCNDHDVFLIVDAVSSLGGTQLKTDDWNVDICVSASQKGLEAPPGIAPVSVSLRAWDLIDNTPDPGWYLNLKTWRKYATEWSDWHPFPVTMAVNNVLALRESLESILDEGLEARFARHREIADFLRNSFRNLGFELLVEEDYYSTMVTAVLRDSRFTVDDLKNYLEKERSIKIAGSLGDLEGKVFRIGHMGPTATYDAVLPLMYGIEEFLRKNGEDIEHGAFFGKGA